MSRKVTDGPKAPLFHQNHTNVDALLAPPRLHSAEMQKFGCFLAFDAFWNARDIDAFKYNRAEQAHQQANQGLVFQSAQHQHHRKGRQQRIHPQME